MSERQLQETSSEVDRMTIIGRKYTIACDEMITALGETRPLVYVLGADHMKPGDRIEVAPSTATEGAVSAARAEQRETTIRHAAEWLRTLGRDDMAVALVRALSVTDGGQ